MTTPASPRKGGGAYLLAIPAGAFCPEDCNEQHRLIAQTVAAFARDEIEPASEAIEKQDFATVRTLLAKAGELGLTGVDVPEEYGGLGLDFISSALVADRIAVSGSFSVIFGAHVGLGTLPLVYFGNHEQKRRYLPGLAAGTRIGAYALSEAGSGSDAMALRTQAQRSATGNYAISGEKMWISNAGFADLFTAFAKVDGKVTAFLVDADGRGVKTGAEEHKMGILGSSTRPLLLCDAQVAQENRLGAEGQGQLIAFQILNAGRFKLGAACVGGARQLLPMALNYARQRRAFGRAIGEFGMIQQALAGMLIGLFASESTVYRTVGMFGTPGGLEALDDYAVECAMVKVHTSEMLDRFVDQLVQIHGGNGFVREYAAERAYRDSRVNRIFEGTNEINRLLIAGLTLRRAERGQLELAEAIEKVRDQLSHTGTPMVEAAEAARQGTLFLAGAALERHRQGLLEQQEILAGLADFQIATYVLQSIRLRAAKLKGAQHELGAMMATVVASETLAFMEMQGQQLLAAISEGEQLATQALMLRRLLKREPVDSLRLRRTIAVAALDHGHYPLEWVGSA